MAGRASALLGGTKYGSAVLTTPRPLLPLAILVNHFAGRDFQQYTRSMVHRGPATTITQAPLKILKTQFGEPRTTPSALYNWPMQILSDSFSMFAHAGGVHWPPPFPLNQEPLMLHAWSEGRRYLRDLPVHIERKSEKHFSPPDVWLSLSPEYPDKERLTKVDERVAPEWRHDNVKQRRQTGLRCGVVPSVSLVCDHVAWEAISATTIVGVPSGDSTNPGRSRFARVAKPTRG